MKYPSYCCQKCGELIGWISRVLPFHKCKEKNMNSLPRYNEKGQLDTRLKVDPLTGDVGIGTPKEKKYMTKDEALQQALDALTDFDYNKRMSAIESIKEALETKEEPVSWVDLLKDAERIAFNTGKVEYVAPQRTWVGLTDEDMNHALNYWSDDSRSAYGGAHSANGEYVDMIETWRYIEAKLKEFNT